MNQNEAQSPKAHVLENFSESMSMCFEVKGKVREQAEKVDAKWRKIHATVRTEEGLSHETTSWTQMNAHNVRSLVGKKERVMDLLDIGYLIAKKNAPDASDEDLCKDLFCDISQSADRRPFSQGELRTLTTSSELFSYGQARLLLPCEHLLALGFDKLELKNISATAVKSMAGGAFALPTMAMALSSVVMSLPGYWENL
eukprot:6476680-Amphidinium_carterae.4